MNSKITGIVQKHLGRGKKLGFPTANLQLSDSHIEDGIYASLTYYSGKEYQSLAFVGVAETFGETERRLEVYLFDFSGDLYGQEITVKLVSKIRENRKFDSADELIKEIKNDEIEAREFFNNYNVAENLNE